MASADVAIVVSVVAAATTTTATFAATKMSLKHEIN